MVTNLKDVPTETGPWYESCRSKLGLGTSRVGPNWALVRVVSVQTCVAQTLFVTHTGTVIQTRG